jgi:rhodanese-related sulfurtransferase
MEIERTLHFLSNHWMLSSGHFIVSLLLIQDLAEAVTRKYKTVSPTGAIALLNQDGTLILDVREPHEYAKGHIEGARHITLGRLKEKIIELEPHKAKPVIVYCQQGTRSKEACKQLVNEGFGQVYYLEGGIITWQDQKLPLVKKSKK